jgi:SAM-dependent methyltransferase
MALITVSTKTAKLRSVTAPFGVTGTYSSGFYDDQSVGSRRSARETIPLLERFVHVSSVLDVGCGVGTWLGEFRTQGVTDVVGLDGAYVEPKNLQIPRENFVPCDLTHPPALGRKFDLVMSLEVAEHLPASAADGFVRYLTSFSPVVMFSAAVPGQGGKHHVNEQWPDYWAARFEQHGFTVVDCLRPLLWNNPLVEWWYAQNTFMFVRNETLANNSALRDAATKTDRKRLAIVHPRAYQAAQGRFELVSLRRAVRLAESIVRATFLRRDPRPEPFAGALGKPER